MQTVDPRHPHRQDTFDLRGQMHSDPGAEAAHYISTDDEEHSVLEDDSDGEDRDVDYMDDDDDGSSSLSIPNESIDFDLVYSLHSFAATVEGQANVVKGDSLFLMDDTNSYWWLVRVLKTQEVGYIPAENIETPFERLARLNKHRNVDLASATQAEQEEGLGRERLAISRAKQSPSPLPPPNGTRSRSRQEQQNHRRGVNFTPALYVHRYPPAVWNEEEEEEEDIEWDDEAYEDEDPSLAEEQREDEEREAVAAARLGVGKVDLEGMEPDDGMGWEKGAAEAAQLKAQKQRQELEQERQRESMEQQQREMLAQQQDQQRQVALAQQQQQTLRSQTSREQLVDQQLRAASPQSARQIDPFQATETRKLTVTPTIAREQDRALLKQEEERKREREEEAAAEEAARKRSKGKNTLAAPVSSASLAKGGNGNGAKLRKEQRDQSTDDESGKKDKKKGSVFGKIFGRKDKERGKNSSIGSMDSAEIGRTSEESSRSRVSASTSAQEHGAISPTTMTAMQQQQQQQSLSLRTSTEPSRSSTEQSIKGSSTPPSSPPEVSVHASQLRQRDLQQQQIYQQYLNRSPSSPPEAQANYGLQTASAVMAGHSRVYHSPGTSASGNSLGIPSPSSSSSRPRPGSLVFTQNVMEGIVPELSVIRVFAGDNLQTEATFKTVLLNSSTTSADLVRQALQRFRLPAGDDANDYFLTVKQMEGSSAVLRPTEQPLGVFESLVEAAMEMPKVKRSSVGSISSISSNLSMHPAIKKLPMNDFTDDSAVKFYLNRKAEEGAPNDSLEGDETLQADTSHDSEPGSPGSNKYLTVSTSQSNANVTPERFSSPSFRFAMQLVIYPDDLPDDMVFDPLTEAIVFKNTLRDRPQGNPSYSSGISTQYRRKVFVFPKNVTVAEVIEIGLERFGISEGVVDGGDEVEDKTTKRKSAVRVRYGLFVSLNSEEQELGPSSKIIDAFPQPPILRAAPRDNKRRSIDSAQLLGNVDDVGPDDPVFVLRRATSYRNSSSRHRTSAPLDEIALQKLHRQSASSNASSTSVATDVPQSPVNATTVNGKQQTRQELIAAQRAAQRANQHAIIRTQANSVRGVDLLLPGGAGMLRSARHDSVDRMRYSYVEPDGETWHDISDIVEEEWGRTGPSAHKSSGTVRDTGDDDVLVASSQEQGIGERLERVLSKIKRGGTNGTPTAAAATHPPEESDVPPSPASQYSLEYANGGNRSRSTTPNSGEPTSRTPIPIPPSRNMSRAASSYATARSSPTPTNYSGGRPETATPTAALGKSGRKPSVASVASDDQHSRYATPTGQLASSSPESPVAPHLHATSHKFGGTGFGGKNTSGKLMIPKGDFGISQMMAVIESNANAMKPRMPASEEKHDPLDEMLFGKPLVVENLHPQVRDIYVDAQREMDKMDQILDNLLQQVVKT